MKNLTSIGERLRLFLEAERMRPNTLARKSGNSSTQIYNILNGRKYGTDKLLQIIEALPTINIYWLLLGEGNMYATQSDTAMESVVVDEDKVSALEKEVENLKSMIKLQEMTIHAYRRTSELAESSLDDLKRIATFYKERSEDVSSKNLA